jgi:hypothetical protein
MDMAWRLIFLVLAPWLIGCRGDEPAATPPPEKMEEMRQQYIEQSKAFNAEPKPGAKK